MKTIIIALLTCVSILAASITSSAQTVGGIPTNTICTVYKKGAWYTFTKPAAPVVDGNALTIWWSYPTATLDLTAEVTIVRVVDGQDMWAYSLTTSGSKNPSTGKLNWTPRVLEKSGEQYKIRISWKNMFGELITSVDSSVFTMNLSAPRYITMTEPMNLVEPMIVSRGTATWIRWQSSGLPANAKMICVLQPYDNVEAGIKIFDSSDTGGHLWTIDPDLNPGKYFLTIYYVTEYGTFGAVANAAIVNVY